VETTYTVADSGTWAQPTISGNRLFIKDATSQRAWGRRADEEARRALEQDGSLADAHFAIASAAGTLYGEFQWDVVLDRSAAALAIDPSLDLARGPHACLLPPRPVR
jgi:hypothetical protein